MSLWIAPVPYDKSRGRAYNFLTPWRWRGVSWRVPFTRRIGFVSRVDGRWSAFGLPGGRYVVRGRVRVGR